MNSGRNERRAIVNWQNENAKDTRLLQLGSLSPLDSLPVTADGDLVGLAEMHNEHLVRAADRVRQLAADREKLADFDAWQEADCTDIGSAVCHVKRESWDTVLYLRRVLQEREIVLQQVKARLRERHERLYAAHVETVAAAEKRLTKERRALEKASPSTAGSHFADLMAEDEQVVAAAEASAAVKQGFEAAATALRAIPEDLREIKRRQRELFEVMVA